MLGRLYCLVYCIALLHHHDWLCPRGSISMQHGSLCLGPRQTIKVHIEHVCVSASHKMNTWNYVNVRGWPYSEVVRPCFHKLIICTTKLGHKNIYSTLPIALQLNYSSFVRRKLIFNNSPTNVANTKHMMSVFHQSAARTEPGALFHFIFFFL